MHHKALTFYIIFWSVVGLSPSSFAATDSAKAQDHVDELAAWMRTAMPAIPADRDAAIAKSFVEKNVEQHPEIAVALSTGSNEFSKLESGLLREAASQLTTSDVAPLREQLARRRVALVSANNGESSVTEQNASELIEKLNTISPVYKQRLLEGKVDDDDLWFLLKRVDGRKSAPVSAAPHTLTASEIVDEYARRNQTGGAALHLEAYTMKATLHTATGETQELYLFKMRPNRLRLIVKSGGKTQLAILADGRSYWQEVAGLPATEISASAMGSRKYLAEFLNPLFLQEGYVFTRLEDGKVGDRKVYRLNIARKDGSKYISCIDEDNFRELAHEQDNGLRIELSDFRDLGGITIAFHEALTADDGKQSQFQIERVTPNPGLISDLFRPAGVHNNDYYSLEQAFAASDRVSSKEAAQ